MIEIQLNPALQREIPRGNSTLFEKSHGIYKDKINKGEIGFPSLIHHPASITKIKALGSLWKKNFSHLLILGIGGSSLGAQAITRALAPHSDKKIIFLDNIDPDELIPLTQKLNWKKTGIFFVSKSGSTLETWAQWIYLEKSIHKNLGKNWKNHILTCTDPHKGDLYQWTKTNDLESFEIPSNVGGRFSVLTAVGLFPAAFLGLKPEKLIQGACEWGDPRDWSQKSPSKLTPLLEALVAAHGKGRKIHVLMPYVHHLDIFSKWFIQLWAESLGKTGPHGPEGSTPLAALGVTDQHSQMQLFMQGPQDKVLGFIWNKGPKSNGSLPKSKNIPANLKFISSKSLRKIFESEFEATRMAFEETQRPTYSLILPKLNEESLGALFYLYAHLTALFGFCLGINPMDQPGVERAKELARHQLSTSPS